MRNKFGKLVPIILVGLGVISILILANKIHNIEHEFSDF